LGSDLAHGLSRAEAERRLDQYGPNRLKSAPETPWWTRLIEQFQNFLVIILLVATVISMVEWLLQDPRETALPYEAIVILLIVLLNALLGFFQEARAERSVRALMALAAPESTVVRDGERERIAADRIVPGDIVLVEAGDRVPADARLIESANLHTDEATAATCCIPARSPHMGAAARSWSRPGWQPRSAASRGCWRPPRRSRPRCSRSSTAPANA
jgi:Ca2+-transporting ATPase